jgi:uncharacterized repeat protein (TIGR01451 family)
MTLNGTSPQFVQPGETGPFVLRLTPNTGAQVASAWYNSSQTVQNGFSTSFQFQFTGASNPPADGIAFVIQNSGTGAIGYTGGNGGALGYGDADASTDPSTGQGIPNSLAIEFDTYQNSWDPPAAHVALQSCGTGKNTSHHGQLCGGDTGSNSTLGAPVNTPNLADGAIHNVTITYVPACATCVPATPANIHVILDSVDLFPTGVNVDLSSIGLGEGGTAYVGFTGATGADVENQDILSWTFTPQSQSGTVSTGTETILSFSGGVDNGGYNYNAELNSGSPVTAQVTPITMASQTACNSIVNPSFPGAQCFVYQNADGSGANLPVMFELTCPGSPGGTCGSNVNPNFDAILGTDFNFTSALNPFNPTEPLVGWLKGGGPDALHPCTPYPNNTSPLFQSNQIISFAYSGDPTGNAKGGSGGTGSCWLLTYNTPYEAPSVNIVSPANGATYQQGQATQANYSCTTANNGNNAAGPYLTTASCSATDSPGGSVAQGAQFDTATLGLHTFKATVVDSGTDTVSQTVTYNVVGSTDLAILNSAPPTVGTGKKLTYVIGVGDLGSATAVNVSVNDVLPAGMNFSSASGTNVACSIVNKKLSCSTTSIPCTFSAGAVSCNVGTVMPLSLYSLNGAVIQITAVVTAPSGTVLKNTATVSASNADTKLSNNSSTATTTVR